MRLGVISNPDSYRNLHEANQVRLYLRNRGEVIHRDARNANEIFDVMPEFARAETDVLVINGGDGTVGAVLTAVLRDGVFEKTPHFVLIPAGRTNAIAHDVGQTGSPLQVAARVVEAAHGERPIHRIVRPVMRLDLGENGDPLHGMLLGGAALYDWVRLARETIEPLGFTRSSLVWLTVAQLFFRYFASRSARKTFLVPTNIAIDLDGKAEPARDYALFLATTLRRLPARLNPFWGAGDGMLRYSFVTYPPRRPLSGAILMMLGRARPWMAPAGFRSGRARHLALSSSRPLVLDGEFVEPPPVGDSIGISANNVVSFISC